MMSKNHSKLIRDFESFKKNSKKHDLVSMKTNDIFDLILLKNQIDFERTKIIEEENRQIGSMKKYISQRTGGVNSENPYISKRVPFQDLSTSVSAKTQRQFSVSEATHQFRVNLNCASLGMCLHLSTTWKLLNGSSVFQQGNQGERCRSRFWAKLKQIRTTSKMMFWLGMAGTSLTNILMSAMIMKTRKLHLTHALATMKMKT